MAGYIDHKSIARMFRDGHSQKDIARAMNLDYRAVRKSLIMQHLKTYCEIDPDIRIDKIIVSRVVTAGDHGGTQIASISLPRISMHVAVLQEAVRP